MNDIPMYDIPYPYGSDSKLLIFKNRVQVSVKTSGNFWNLEFLMDGYLKWKPDYVGIRYKTADGVHSRNLSSAYLRV